MESSFAKAQLKVAQNFLDKIFLDNVNIIRRMYIIAHGAYLCNT